MPLSLALVPALCIPWVVEEACWGSVDEPRRDGSGGFGNLRGREEYSINTKDNTSFHALGYRVIRQQHIRSDAAPAPAHQATPSHLLLLNICVKLGLHVYAHPLSAKLGENMSQKCIVQVAD